MELPFGNSNCFFGLFDTTLIHLFGVLDCLKKFTSVFSFTRCLYNFYMIIKSLSFLALSFDHFPPNDLWTLTRHSCGTHRKATLCGNKGILYADKGCTCTRTRLIIFHCHQFKGFKSTMEKSDVNRRVSIQGLGAVNLVSLNYLKYSWNYFNHIFLLIDRLVCPIQ